MALHSFSGGLGNMLGTQVELQRAQSQGAGAGPAELQRFRAIEMRNRHRARPGWTDSKLS